MLPFALFYVLVSLTIIPALIEKTEGPSTKKQIENSFSNSLNTQYELLILGNSGAYRGINPACFDVPSFNFSHDNDSYNQMYYKLVWLLEHGKKPKFVIVGVDYFQFSFISDTRNYVYSEFLGKNYMNDYASNSNLIVKLESWFEEKNIFKFSRMKYLINLLHHPDTTIHQKNNGQYIKPGKALPNNKYSYSIKRLNIQVTYFEKLLTLCSQMKCKVFLTMLPVRKNALNNYTQQEIEEFNRFITLHTNANIFYMNYSLSPDYNIEDYTDITHLNERAANKFSFQLNNFILSKFK